MGQTSTKAPPIVTKRKTHKIQGEITMACDNYERALIRRALYKTNDYEMSKDLVQTTFLKTIQYLRKGGRIDMMRSFLSHILNALIVDEYRKKKPVSLDALLENGFEPGFDDSKSTENIIDGEQIIFLIPQLPRKYAEVIQMRYLKSLSLKEMALLTGQSENTVAVQVHRGLVKLRKLYIGE
ncbi:sigma-70 family RNA polymerase sigma factor [Patescibacteria group bacterium]|nr:sigma-70 family RNA polymerase sigma factor [Patescibacteria group bacterium]